MSGVVDVNEHWYFCSDGVEKQPLATVGSPYWMAPEVLRGELYNEKVNMHKPNQLYTAVQY